MTNQHADATPEQTPEQIQQQIQQQIDELRATPAESRTPCASAICLAWEDARVRELFFRKLHNPNYRFHGVRCLSGETARRQTVLFDFECKPDIVCLFRPWFAVEVDLDKERVIAIQDPYFPREIHHPDRPPLLCPPVFAGPVTLTLFAWRFWLLYQLAWWDTACLAFREVMCNIEPYRVSTSR
jgi:hypothetical protein